VKKSLANSEPSTHGTKGTCRDEALMSAFRGKAIAGRAKIIQWHGLSLATRFPARALGKPLGSI
jgi:hypothetical protein